MNFDDVKAVGSAFENELSALGFETRWIDLPESVSRAGHIYALKNSLAVLLYALKTLAHFNLLEDSLISMGPEVLLLSWNGHSNIMIRS